MLKYLYRKKALFKIRKKGFTLVELVVVIAVIGVLAAIISPILYGMVKEARHVSMINDARIALNAAKEAMVRITISGEGLNPVYNIDGAVRGSITNYSLYRAQRDQDSSYLNGNGTKKASYADYIVSKAILEALDSAAEGDARYAFNYASNPTGQTLKQFNSNSHGKSCGMILIYNSDGGIYQLQFAYGDLFCEYSQGEYKVYEINDANAKFRTLPYTGSAA